MCCTNITGTPSARARSTVRATFWMIRGASHASFITPTYTSTTTKTPLFPARTVAAEARYEAVRCIGWLGVGLIIEVPAPWETPQAR